ncbi:MULTISPECIES: abortive infection family protein [unclassified Rhodococcus (in: high G+C Gram-positive bacteria)]|uniref:abortive infection family protein n=1 Tax=unclassified Rhodococcus (in: high G+C Gram-positive bacteria) TaxID=192944 RepID=UPI00163B2647|nr:MULTISPECIES: abortive infection family protein [unclassified Rhodococcus (in: high G+C Gram-positive bacteria)]MBC2644434.1 abortive infection family protein [Rhodococcus sp. 3A]MBC2897874.1 abortive infection family protein [Rhodococcus sp. 4CII]
MPSSRSTLPYRIIKLATDMFARDTGFSGPDIHRIFADYTDVLGSYTMSGGGPSRWQLFETGLNSLSVDDQRRFLLDLCTYDGSSKYTMPSEDDIAKLRSMLLEGSVPGSMAASDRLDQLDDWDAVRRSWDAALDKIVSDPEGAITATRTTLESICKHICDERGASYDDGGDLSKLYKAAASAMNIAPDQHTEQIIKQILSGVGTVVNGLAAMRNSLSDSHGRGKSSVRPAPRHAKLAVNAGFAVAGFLIDTHVEKPTRP